jgi:O-antigen ligase
MTITAHRLINGQTLRHPALRSRSGARFRYVPAAARRIPNSVRWSYLLFIFSLPFEATDLGFMSGSLSLARLSGLLFFAFYFLHYGLFPNGRSFAQFPRAMGWFLLYATIFAVNALLRPVEAEGSNLTLVFTLAQLLMFFWLTSDLLKTENMMRLALLTYASACVLLAIGMVGGLPGFSSAIGEGRVEAIGDNPNASGQHFVLAALVLLGLILNGTFKRWVTNKVLIPLATMVLLAGMVATGSRSAIVAFIIGCGTYLFPRVGSRRILISAILGAFGIGAAVYMIAKNPDFVERWQATYYDEDWAGRQDIYGSAIEMILEEPILGWGPAGAFAELGRRVNWVGGRDAHNLMLDLLMSVGIVGAIPFLVGLGLCVRAAWKARSTALGMLPLALITANLAASMGHTNLTWKPQWFVLALTCAVASVASSRRSGAARLSRAMMARTARLNEWPLKSAKTFHR